MMIKPTLLLFPAVLILAVPAYAAGFGAAISYSRYSTDFDFDHSAINDADVDELALTIGESITPLFDLALQGGYTRVDAGGHPAADGYHLTGRFYGLVARTEPTLIPGLLSLRVEGAYRWHSVDNGRVNHQYDELTWRDAELRAGPVLDVGPVKVSAGGYLERYDGHEKAHGPLAFRRDFDAGGSGGAFATVALSVGDHGHIDFYAQSGVRRGYGINFSTGF